MTVGIIAVSLLAAVHPEALKARTALKTSCAKCHAGGPEADEGGFDFLFDRDALVREGLLSPGHTASSKLFKRVLKGEMPPPEELTSVAPADRRKRRNELMQTLTAWIAAGAPDEGFSTPRPPAAKAVTQEELVRAMVDDLRDVPSTQRRFIRYFTGEAGPALDKALSSLTWAPHLIKPAVVTPELRRVDLRELQWSAEEWDRVLVAAYPFSVATSSVDELALAQVTGCAQPFLRADWFVSTATRPPLYHQLLRLPSNEPGLEALLDVRVKEDVSKGAVVRAGFNNSGVSRNNRLIERHAGRYGPYWRSYDFASNVGQRNLFERPLTFVHDGGEHIFSLPNGMFAYLLTDAHGNRIDHGPTRIVRDERRPDGAVENGLSCMGCHARGFIPKVDQLLSSVESSPAAFTARDRRQLELLHPEAATLAGIFELDDVRFLSALEGLGVPPDGEEPINAVALKYEKSLDLQAAALELAVAPHVLFRALDGSLSPLRVNGSVKRDAFTAAFPSLVRRLGIGRAQPLTLVAAVPPPECRSVEDCALAFPEKALHGVFRLAARTSEGKETWLDDHQHLYWSAAQPAASQSAAAEQCSAQPEGLWFLPSAEQLQEAFEDGLPRDGWAPFWSRDIDQRHKYDAPPGVAVSVRGPSSEPAHHALSSRCISRAQ
jgi:hypothetical protein